jgi:hypothetical protein
MKKILTLAVALIGSATATWAQDIITLRNGEEIKAKVQEVGVTEVKYKKFDNLAGPAYTLPKTEIFMIKYEDGERDVFKDAPAPVTAKTPAAAVKQDGGATLLTARSGVVYDSKTSRNLSPEEVRTLMAACPEALQLYDRAQHQEVWSYVMAGVGGGLIGWGLGSMIVNLAEGADVAVENYLFMITGTGVVAAAFILVGAAVKNVKTSVNLYNNAVSGRTSAFSGNLRFGLTRSGGVGLTLTF